MPLRTFLLFILLLSVGLAAYVLTPRAPLPLRVAVAQGRAPVFHGGGGMGMPRGGGVGMPGGPVSMPRPAPMPMPPPAPMPMPRQAPMPPMSRPAPMPPMSRPGSVSMPQWQSRPSVSVPPAGSQFPRSGWHPPVAYPMPSTGRPVGQYPAVRPMVVNPRPATVPPVTHTGTLPGHPPITTTGPRPAGPATHAGTLPGRPPTATGHRPPGAVSGTLPGRPQTATGPRPSGPWATGPRPATPAGATWQPYSGRPVAARPMTSFPGRLPAFNANHLDTMHGHVGAATPGHGAWQYSHGQGYYVPQHGWVTGWHHNYNHMNTCYLNPYAVPWPTVCSVGNYWAPYWGSNWNYNPYGYYWNNSFWFNIGWGALAWWNYNTHPVYVFSPISQYYAGELTPPTNGFSTEEQVYLYELSIMAQEDANDAYAGLYMAASSFDPLNPGAKITAAYAYHLLRQGQPIYYHPPGGAYELINSVDDLRAYLYLRESRNQAPPQSPTP